MLVVDDDAVLRTLLRLTLELEGHDVLVAQDGEEALDLLGTEAVDAVVLDAVMPRLDGWTACERLRADARLSWLPVLMVSGRTEEADRRRAEQAGADVQMGKPFEPDDLVAAVADAVRLGRRRRTGATG